MRRPSTAIHHTVHAGLLRVALSNVTVGSVVGLDEQSFKKPEQVRVGSGPATQVIVNDTCPGCVDHSKGMFSSYSMGIGGPADNFVPAMSYWAQPHPHVRAARPLWSW